MEEKQQYVLIPEALPKALFVVLKILFYFIVLPYKIWKASTLRLAHISNDALLSDDEEFPVYTISKIVYDAIIVILPILGIITGIFFSNSYFYFRFSFILIFLIYYFMIPIVSFIKEILTITLSMVHSLEKIEKNTDKS